MTSIRNKQYRRNSLCSSLLQLVVFIIFISIPPILAFGVMADVGSNESDQPQAEHADQQEFYELVVSGNHHQAFEQAFELGDELFETQFNALDGVGAHVAKGQRFTRVPRADLSGFGEWADHTPKRETGPNAQACNACHNLPFDDGAGQTNSNVHRDPLHSANLSMMIQRNTPHLFGAGAVQLLAEEMTKRLHRIQKRAARQACNTGKSQTRILRAKGVHFGMLTVRPIQNSPCQVTIDSSKVIGVFSDLIIRPFQWKGNNTTLRDFNRGASHNELGMQAVELVGRDEDSDFDGVTNEMTIGDQTALAIYIAAQPRPTTKIELSHLGLIEPLSSYERKSIRRGKKTFAQIGCASCHSPTLKIKDPIFREPSLHAHHRDEFFPSGLNPLNELVDPAFPVTFDLTRDQPDNIVHNQDGQEIRLGTFERDRRGRAIVRLYGDLKHHNLGSNLAESIDETGTGASTWLTKELWGVGSTAPYLHDGRATTLTDAIQSHGGEASPSRQAFDALSPSKKKDLVTFLNNLVLFKVTEEE